MSIHSGHRQRVKSRFREEGLDHFDEIHVLELLLFYAVPQKDTNPMAHALLEHFGSLTNVLDAPATELEKVPGIGENVSTFLTLITQLGRYYQVKKTESKEALKTIPECGRFLLPYFFGREVETVFLLCLDAKCELICCKKVGEGSVNSASIPVRRVVEMALSANASTVVLAHNHPSGIAIPSAEDIQTTHRMAKALEAVEIILADHIVIAKDDFVSIAQSRLYMPSDESSVR